MPNPPETRRKLTFLTVEERIQIIELHEAGWKVGEIANDCKVPQSTVSTVVKNKQKWLEKKAYRNLRKPRAVGDVRVEKSMELFVRQAQDNNQRLTCSMLREKAKEFAQEFGNVGFKASSGWLSKFVKRHQITLGKQPSAGGEAGDRLDTEMYTLPELIQGEFNDGLDELLSKAKAAGATGGADSTSSAAAPKPAVTSSTSEAVALTATTTATSATTTTGQGKISVVPTNLLLKPPTSTVNLNSPIQIYTQPTVSLAGSTTITAIPQSSIASSMAPSATGMAPMKLLLVNTVSKDGTTKQILTPASEVPTMRPPPMLAPKPTPIPIAPKPPTVSIPALNVPSRPPTMTPIITATSGAAKPKPPSFLNGEKSSGFKTLLTQLVTIQRENLAVSRARLALDKERLEFEKQIGGPLVDVVRNLSGFFNGFLQQFQHQQQQLQQKQTQMVNGTTKRQSDPVESAAAKPAKKRRTTGSVEAVETSVTTTIKPEVIVDNDN